MRLILAVGVLLLGATVGRGADAITRTVDKSRAFAYVLPVGWATLAAPNYPYDVILLPAGGGFNRNIIITDQPGTASLPELQRKYERDLARALQDFALVSSAVVELPAQREVLRIVQTNTAPGVPIRQINYVVAVGDKRYFLACTVLQEDGDKFDQEFDAFVRTLAQEAHGPSSNAVAQAAAVPQGQPPPASPGKPVIVDENRWADSVTATNDPTYQQIIMPWLKKNKLEFPAEGDGLLVVYQPWGPVSGAALFVPGKTEGSLALFNAAQEAVQQLPLPAEEWATVRRVALDGKFFDLPYRNAKMGMDGASVYVEARIDGRHHRVCHWQPDAPVVQRLANLIGRRPDYFFPADRATSGAAWQAVASAMQAGDKQALAKVCTAKGYQSIVKGLRAQEASADDLRTWATAWSKWPLRFQSQTTTAAEASFGSELKEHGVWFIKTADGWKLDQWQPGK
jgi:hypothetical protein